jgi:hypothetical protein
MRYKITYLRDERMFTLEMPDGGILWFDTRQEAQEYAEENIW